MLAAVGHPVRALHRSTYAGLTLDGLEPGQWRELELPEVERLKRGEVPDADGGAGKARPS
jgi:16S rRNA U516 pseudouridylate synthase RsuA-like enzyme